MKKAVPFLMIAVAWLTGCASSQYCLKPKPYQSARSIKPLHGTDSLQVPVSDAALVVPPPPKQQVPFGRKVKGGNGHTHVVCLDQPPPLPKQTHGTTVTR